MTARLRVACSVEEHVYDRLVAIADAYEWPLSRLLSQAVEAVLEEHEREWITPSPRRRYVPLRRRSE